MKSNALVKAAAKVRSPRIVFRPGAFFQCNSSLEYQGAFARVCSRVYRKKSAGWTFGSLQKSFAFAFRPCGDEFR